MIELPHGYTMESVREAAKLATHTAYITSMSYADRYDEAWSAIVEHIYTAEHRPFSHDLVRVGRAAISARYIEYKRHAGYANYMADGTMHGPGTGRRFTAYWFDFLAMRVRSHEDNVVEKVALAQILSQMPPTQRQVIVALAVHDDYHAAATSLGMGKSTFNNNIARARRRFLELWHEGEVPSRPWGSDRRLADRSKGRAVQRPSFTDIFGQRRRAARTRAAAKAALRAGEVAS